MNIILFTFLILINLNHEIWKKGHIFNLQIVHTICHHRWRKQGAGGKGELPYFRKGHDPPPPQPAHF